MCLKSKRKEIENQGLTRNPSDEESAKLTSNRNLKTVAETVKTRGIKAKTL